MTFCAVFPAMPASTWRERSASRYKKTDVAPYDVREADEAWITSAPFSMIPVTRFNFQAVGNGKPGGIYRRLLAAWE